MLILISQNNLPRHPNLNHCFSCYPSLLSSQICVQGSTCDQPGIFLLNNPPWSGIGPGTRTVIRIHSSNELSWLWGDVLEERYTGEGRFVMTCYGRGDMGWYWDGFLQPSSGSYLVIGQPKPSVQASPAGTRLLFSIRERWILNNHGWSLSSSSDLHFFHGDPKPL